MSPQSVVLPDLRVAEALRGVAGPVFAAVWSDRSAVPQLIVHASSAPDKSALKSNIIKALDGVVDVRPQIKFHRTSSLLTAKSLQSLVARLGGDRIAYDPTGSLVRGKALVSASQAVRAALKDQVGGLYYAPLLRTFYVTLERTRVATGDQVRLSNLAGIEHAVLEALQVAFGNLDSGTCPAVRVGFGLPSASLVPIDSQSVTGWGTRVVRAARKYWKPVTVAALFGLGSVSAAQAQEAAVSEPNLKVRGSFGQVIDDYSWNVEGAFTAPLTQRFGVMVEGGVGGKDNSEHYGVGGHLFARDPESYLVGVFGAYSKGSDFDIDATRFGGEFEFYLNDLTVSGAAGYQFSSILGDKTFGNLDFKWYTNDNFAVTAGVLADEDRLAGRGRLEWQPGFAALPGLAFNADGVWGEDDYHSIMGGLTYYFGSPVSLKDRHRRQDPESALFGLFQAVQQERDRIAVEQAQLLCAQYGGPGCVETPQ